MLVSSSSTNTSVRKKRGGLVRYLLWWRFDDTTERMKASNRALWARLVLLERKLDELMEFNLTNKLAVSRLERKFANLTGLPPSIIKECFSTSDSNE